MFFGMSLQVATANTPGCASAFDVSMLTMRALWCGERRPLQASMPWTDWSATYFVRPVTWAIPS